MKNKFYKAIDIAVGASTVWLAVYLFSRFCHLLPNEEAWRFCHSALLFFYALALGVYIALRRFM